MSTSEGAKKVKKPAEHPKYMEMVKAALATLKERNGSSRQAILKYIKANYKVGDNADNQVKKALKKGVAAGALKHTTGAGASGSFKLLKPETPKEKPKPRKKPTKPKTKKAPSKAKKSETKSPAKGKGAKKPSEKSKAKKKVDAKSKKSKPKTTKKPKKVDKKPAKKGGKSSPKKKPVAKKSSAKGKK